MQNNLKQSVSQEKSNIWLKEEEICFLLGIKKDTLRRKLVKNEFEYKCNHNWKIKNYSINLLSLPQWVQQKYFDTFGTSANDPLENYMRSERYKRERCDKYFSLIKMSNGLKGQALKEFVENWNDENEDNKTSYAAILRARNIFYKYGFDGLLGKGNIRKGNSSVDDEYFNYFKNHYLSQNKASMMSSWLYTLGYAIRVKGINKSNFPSLSSFKRRIKNDIPEQIKIYNREGEAKWNRSWGNYIERDYSMLKSNKCWVSDHAQIDVMVIGKNGKPCCPWVTAWRDMKSNKWLGWLLHEESGNSDHIFQSFYYAAEAYGLPEDIILDNGKDYRSKDFAGGRKASINAQNNDQLSMVQKLGINVHFALPYNAQTKPIERDFLKIKETLSRHCVGFRGGNVLERPEKLKDEIKQEKLSDKYCQAVDFAIL